MFLLYFLILQMSVVSSEKPVGVPSSLESVREAFRSKGSFEVSFTQVVEQELFPEEQMKATGRIYFKRPQGLRWVYESPPSQVKEIVFDGEALWLIRGNQREELPQPEQLALHKCFAFLWGEADLDNFELRELDSSRFEIKPKTGKSVGFQSIEVRVENSRVAESRVKDHLDGLSHFRFHNWQLQP